MSGERSKRSERHHQLFRGACAIKGGVEIGKTVADALQDSNNLFSPETVARSTQVVVVFLIVPAVLDKGSRAFKTVIIDNIKEEVSCIRQGIKRRRQNRGREER